MEDEKLEKEKLLAKKRQKLTQRKLGFLPCKDWIKKEEKNLMKITTKGVVKLFNSIYQFRKKIKDEKEIDGMIQSRFLFIFYYFFLRCLLINFFRFEERKEINQFLINA